MGGQRHHDCPGLPGSKSRQPPRPPRRSPATGARLALVWHTVLLQGSRCDGAAPGSSLQTSTMNPSPTAPPRLGRFRQRMASSLAPHRRERWAHKAAYPQGCAGGAQRLSCRAPGGSWGPGQLLPHPSAPCAGRTAVWPQVSVQAVRGRSEATPTLSPPWADYKPQQKSQRASDILAGQSSPDASAKGPFASENLGPPWTSWHTLQIFSVNLHSTF